MELQSKRKDLICKHKNECVLELCSNVITEFNRETKSNLLLTLLKTAKKKFLLIVNQKNS